MKKIILLFLLLLPSFGIFSQNIIKGTVKNEQNEKIPGAIIKIKNTDINTVSDRNGYFIIKNIKPGRYTLEVAFIGYETAEKDILSDSKETQIDIILKQSDIPAEEVIINAVKAGNNTPVAFSNLNKDEIKQQNTGRDIPYLLDLTPSVTVSSDAGNGIGYTYMRIRGTDMTRINVTIDGIPLNDPESHGVWWVDLPDLASSVENIQIQRGAGTSTNGAAAFGANINFETDKINKTAYAELSQDAGSFNSRKTTVKAGTGLLDKHFAFDLRLSDIRSDGYIDRAFSRLRSYYASGNYFDDKNLIRIKVFGGKEKTYQAWYGVPKDSLQTNRTYNPYTYENEIDDYDQTHYQLFYTRRIKNNLFFNITLFRTDGYGYYEQYKENEDFEDYGLPNQVTGNDTVASTDLIRRKILDNTFTGTVYALNFTNKNMNIIFGGSADYYDGDHFGKIIWSRYSLNFDKGYEWYRNNGTKTEANNYLKINYTPNNKINLWADMQYRHIDYDISGINDDLRDISQEHTYDFFNPKAGINYKVSDKQNAYLSFSVANREPSRTNFKDAAPGEVILPETLYDFEAGYKARFNNAAFNINLYYMDYDNQLILTGEINNTGAYIMSNVPDSYRAGIEIAGGIKINDMISWNANATFSKNKIKNITVYVDNWDTWSQETEFYPETDISFSPGIIAASKLDFNIFKNFKASFTSKYVSRQYIDNTQNKSRSLDPYFVNNLSLSYTLHPEKLKTIKLKLDINNIFDEEYETNAWVYRYIYNGKEGIIDGYFPQAGINFSAGVSLIF
ncbi:MAG: TonB-dependent receptor [Chlorobi bacterium]|nr:TonB-dependent receptor [Chlorobiota bacterium]